EQIGLIIKKLKESGMDRNTIVILSSDQGLAVGSHGLMGKQNQYDHSIRVPLLISGPGIPKGKSIDEDVYLQDIMPTALELAAAPIPSFVEFHSLLPLLNGRSSYLTGGVMGAYIKYQRMIRKDGYKLIVYPNVHKRLLYDMRNDPQELHDLSDNPAYQATVDKLFKELLHLQQQYKDDLDLSAITWN
ncbi:MAG TPA: sulfatase/phosphatase domain-containing protein, partial [Chitinophagaceae bacterium]|nr:sulfatase/phosphatase domain-containing protein [Chitinophagaceae bacterium]